MEKRLAAEPELRPLADELMALRPHVAEAVHAAAGSIDGERIWRNVSERLAARPSVLETFVEGVRLFLRRRVAVGLAAAAVVLVAAFLLINVLTSRQPGKLVAEVTAIDQGDDPNVIVVLAEDTPSGASIVWVYGIDESEVN